MASLYPFKALRPAPEVAARVASPPYDVVSTNEARALADGNPLSFLHVSRAEINLATDTDPHSRAVYEQAATNLSRLRIEAPLLIEDMPSLYVYRLRMGKHEQIGMAGCYSLNEYDQALIKKHEHTRLDKEEDRTRHMLALRAQTGPVFLTYRAAPTVDAVVMQAVTHGALVADVSASDGVQHTLWRVAEEHAREIVTAFSGVPALYIADGHHRVASAARMRREFSSSGAGEWDTFLGVAFPDEQVQILAYNRVVRDLGEHTPDSLLAALRGRLLIAESTGTPVRKGDVSMFLAGHWYRLVLGDAPASVAIGAQLDVARLHDLVLKPLLGIDDIRTDPRVDFVGGARGSAALERMVLSGDAAVAFSMYPVDVADLIMVSDGGEVMPPKSTWFEPKLRDGLLSHLI
jgi:uncharacterized protein (DUF1015 family)